MITSSDIGHELDDFLVAVLRRSDQLESSAEEVFVSLHDRHESLAHVVGVHRLDEGGAAVDKREEWEFGIGLR